jgi:TatD DNase family protein
MLYDTHTHLTHEKFNADRDDIIALMRENECCANTVGVDWESSQAAVALAWEHEHIYAVIGQHPVDNRAEQFDQSSYRKLLAESASVVAIGECGLDFYWVDPDEGGERERQRDIFEAQIELAIRKQLPLMLHIRPSKGTMDAYEEGLEILASHAQTADDALFGTAHFFVGDWAIAKRFFELGFYVSYPGIVTFSREFDEVVQNAPLDRLLAETDAPYAAPEPMRGKRNEPRYVRYTIAKLAELRGISEEEMVGQMYDNGRRLFGV